MTIQQISLPPPVCMAPESSTADALRLLIERGFNHVPICAEGKFLGLLGINDLLLEVIPISARIQGGLTDLSFAGDAKGLLAGMLDKLKTRTAASIMHMPDTVLHEDCPLLEAALLLSKHNSPLPVLNREGQLRGMLSRRVLLSHLIENSGI